MSVEGGSRVTWMLGHRIARRPEGVTEPETPVLQWYELHPVHGERPAEGEARVPVRCGTCGDSAPGGE